jgi:hypothetical protein
MTAPERGAERGQVLGYDQDGDAIERCSICDELIDWIDESSFELEYYKGECIPAHVACANEDYAHYLRTSSNP